MQPELPLTIAGDFVDIELYSDSTHWFVLCGIDENHDISCPVDRWDMYAPTPDPTTPAPGCDQPPVPTDFQFAGPGSAHSMWAACHRGGNVARDRFRLEAVPTIAPLDCICGAPEGISLVDIPDLGQDAFANITGDVDGVGMGGVAHMAGFNGSMTITRTFAIGPEQVTMDGFNNVVTMPSGHLELDDTPLLQSFTGLRNLDRVEESILMRRVGLTTIDILPRLSRAGSITIRFADNLTHIEGIGEADLEVDSLAIEDNPNLVSLGDFVPARIGRLIIEDNPKLTDAAAWAFVDAVGRENISNWTIRRNDPP